MEAHVMEWLHMLFRWAHVITGIAWIGASFYFVWLDNHLEQPTSDQLKNQGVSGEVWAVHGGGFYNPQKYMTAPKKLPKNPHWFYWESYATWMSGFGLFILMYLWHPQVYLIDPTLFPMTSSQAVMAALGFLVVGWVLYDLNCRLFRQRPWILSGLTVLLVVAASFLATQIFPGRAAYLIVGATMATMMTANVLFWIIPGQRKVVAAMKQGDPVNPIHGQIGKQRSVHNTYFTLPVLFCMLSNHFSFLTQHQLSWVLLVLMMLAGVLVRQFFILKHKGEMRWSLPISGLAVMAFVLFMVTPRPMETKDPQMTELGGVSHEKVSAIIQERCYGCHAKNPQLIPGAPAPKGIVFENIHDIQRHARAIYVQTVQQQIMPLGNITKMTEQERQVIKEWFLERS